MKVKSATFLTSATDLASCPQSEMAEFAFIGRSNVGKSSIINMLTHRKELAKVSSMPGKTTLINFFTINQAWSLVDLPGYGFAKVARKERDRFGKLVTDYLQNRQNLAGIFLLIDVLIPPQKIDLEFIQWLISGQLPFILVFTKADRISKSAAEKNIEIFMSHLQEFSEDRPEFVLSSSKQAQGQIEILQIISAALSETPPPSREDKVVSLEDYFGEDFE